MRIKTSRRKKYWYSSKWNFCTASGIVNNERHVWYWYININIIVRKTVNFNPKTLATFRKIVSHLLLGKYAMTYRLNWNACVLNSFFHELINWSVHPQPPLYFASPASLRNKQYIGELKHYYLHFYWGNH